jgi:phycocyanin-associated, rod
LLERLTLRGTQAKPQTALGEIATMLGQSLLTRASSSSSDNRVFVYEVSGLRQNDQTDKNSYPVRHSDNVFIQVSYSHMNEQMRRITRLGGKIVSIQPHAGNSPQTTSPSE